jgi:hypothetical protein
MSNAGHLCSCVICKEVKSSKGIHTHFLRNHGSDEERSRMLLGLQGLQNSAEKRFRSLDLRMQVIKGEYYSNPVNCKQCRIQIPYEKRQNVFCSKSCAATYNNINHKEGRKFGPAKSTQKVCKPRKPRPPILRALTPRKKKVSIRTLGKTWKTNVVGPYTRIYNRVCNICNVHFFSRRISKYCSEHKTHYATMRNRYQFTFNVYKYPELFDLELVRIHGWYSPGNRGPKNNNGVSRDHRVSVSEAIRNNYDPYYITHPLNCELMRHTENKNKYTGSSIKYDELVLLVDAYEQLAEGSGPDPHPFFNRPTT